MRVKDPKRTKVQSKVRDSNLDLPISLLFFLQISEWLMWRCEKRSDTLHANRFKPYMRGRCHKEADQPMCVYHVLWWVFSWMLLAGGNGFDHPEAFGFYIVLLIWAGLFGSYGCILDQCGFSFVSLCAGFNWNLGPREFMSSILCDFGPSPISFNYVWQQWACLVLF